MAPVTIEVHCNLGKNDLRWQEIRSLMLEIGYPGRHGQTLWKHIGWLRAEPLAEVNVSAHALWNHDLSEHTLVFDFQPFVLPKTPGIERSYCLRRSIVWENGRRQVSRRVLVHEGAYSDDFFSCTPQYPKPEI